MMVLVAYDVNTATVAGRRRLRQVAKICEDHGQRVQFSIFECVLEPAMWVTLRASLVKTIDGETDSLRFYHMGANWKPRVEHVGAKPAYDVQGPLIV
jgi:CRISPR-associated protein Cas2